MTTTLLVQSRLVTGTSVVPVLSYLGNEYRIPCIIAPHPIHWYLHTLIMHYTYQLREVCLSQGSKDMLSLLPVCISGWRGGEYLRP